MSFFDKVKNIMSVPDEEDYSDELNQNQDTALEKDDYIESKSSKREYAVPTPFPTEKKGKNMPVAMSQLQVVIVKPERFDDAPSIADHLNNRKTVVLNLESANKENSRRLIDFLSGVAYANHGQIKRVANSTFMITPCNVDVMGDLIIDELEGGFYR